MPALAAAAVDDWIARHEPAVAAVRSVEVELDDLPQILSALDRLGAALDRARDSDPAALAQMLGRSAVQAALQRVLGHLNVQRRLLLVTWLAQAGLPDVHRLLGALYADAGGPSRPDPGVVVRESLQHLHRLVCVQAIFASARVEHLRTLCDNLDEAL